MVARIITLILAVWRNRRTDFYFAADILVLHLWLTSICKRGFNYCLGIAE